MVPGDGPEAAGSCEWNGTDNREGVTMSIRPRVIEEPTPAAAASVQPTLAAQIAGTVPKDPPVSRPAPCLGGGGCDKRPIRFVREKIRGPVCEAVGLPVNQLPGNECPLERKERLAKRVQP